MAREPDNSEKVIEMKSKSGGRRGQHVVFQRQSN